MSSSGRRGEAPTDPRILENQKKIIEYLRRLQEEQRSIKQDVHMIMKESKHFQKNVYQNIQVLSENVNTLQDCVDDLLHNTDSINHRTKSVYKHVKSMNSRQDIVSSPTYTEQNIRPRKHGRGNGARPKKKHTYGLLHPGAHNHLPSYSPDSDTDYSPKKLNLPSKDYNNSDPNLLQPSTSKGQPRSSSNVDGKGGPSKLKKHSKNYLDISDGKESDSHKSGSDTDGPVSFGNQPPDGIPRPQTKRAKQRKKIRDMATAPYMPLDGHEQIGLPQPPLATQNFDHRDCVKLMRQYGLELVQETLTCIQRATQCKGARRWQKGLRTVLIVDVSTSMKGGPLNMAMSFLNRMLDCVDVGADRFALEEFISLIVFGEETSILQQFSNDYVTLRTAINEGLENFEEGRSPLFQALAMALTYIECHGEGVTIHGHDVLPRIIIISDFLITNERNLDGEDVASSDERIKCQGQLFSFMNIVRKRGYQTFCVPVGDYNNQICTEIARVGHGAVINSDRPEDAGLYYRYQVIAGNSLHEFNLGAEVGEEEDIEDLVTEGLITAALPPNDKELVMNFIAIALSGDVSDNDIEEEEIENDVLVAEGGVPAIPSQPKPSSRQQSASPTPSHHSSSHGDSMTTMDSYGDLPEWRVPRGTTSLGFEEIGRLPPLGSRVQRGKDWSWDRQDGQGPGTIVGHKTEGIVFVLWDNNNQLGGYRFGHQGDKYDVEVIRSPRQVEHGCIEIGCFVVRGKDWNKGDEDGGQGTVGVVIRKLPGRTVQVRWPSRVIDTYKFGADDQWEVKVTAEAPLSAQASRAQTPDQPASQTAYQPANMAADERPAIPGEEDTQPVWRWQDRSEQWRIMSPDAINKLEQTYTRNQQGNVMVQMKGKNAKVYLSSMECEINGTKRPIKRELMKVSDVQNLHMVEEMMQD